MNPEDTIVIAVYYGGSWSKRSDGKWQFENYESDLTEVPNNCTLQELEDEVYKIIDVDRDTYSLAMKYQYVLCDQPCAPIKIRRDRDVKLFLRQVKEVVPRTALYVETVLVDPLNNVHGHPFNSRSGSNQYSSHCPQPIREPILRDENVNASNTYEAPIAEDQFRHVQVPTNNEWVPQVPESQWPETQFPEPEWPETIVPETQHIHENEVHPTHLETECQPEDLNAHDGVDNGASVFPNLGIFHGNTHDTECHPPSSKFPSSHYSANNLLPTYHSQTSLPSGSSRFIDIESGSSDSEYFQIGQVYDDKKGLKQKLALYAVTHNFQFKVVRSSTTRYEVQCLYDSCDWKLRANKIPHSENLFIVKKYYQEHNCLKFAQATHGNHRQASSRILGEVIKDKYDGIARVYKPREIKHDIKLNYGVEISYDKAWRAREHALNSIRGTAEQSFSQLPSYFAMLEAKNPGTVTRIATDDKECFQYCFMALGASIRGFRSSIRPVVAVDGTTLKNRYRGYLYIASAVDGNGQIYPLAFGVGDCENEDAYTWFFQCFREAYGESENLVFVTDRHKAIENALKVVYPNTYHGLCMYHISQNLKAKKFGHDDQVLPAFYLAAKSYLSNRFDYYMSELRNINVRVVDYLAEIEDERWARCKFPVTRYNILTTNIAECMNAILRDAREMPLVPLLETIRAKLQQWFHDRRIVAGNMSTPLTTWTEERLTKRTDIAQRMFVQPINPDEYRVIGNPIEGTVNLRTMSCTCKKFDFDQYPCVHAMAACLFRHIECHHMCSHYYRSETLCAAYADSIYPVGPEIQWDIPHEVQRLVVKPPDNKRRSVGRPKKNRIPSQGEEKMQYKCGRCGKVGHNRARCTEPINRDDVGTSSQN